MSLTSAAFVWSLRAALAAAVVWVVVRWPRAAGPGVVAVLRRLVAIAVLVVLGTLNVLAPVNAAWGWYSSWGDLVASLRDEPVVAPSPPRGEPARAAVDTRVGADPLSTLSTTARASVRLALTPTATGGYEHFTVPGPISGYSGTVTVWFPPSYTRPADARRVYPVVETFHGYLPAPLATFSVFHLDAVVESLARQHRLREALLVIPHWAPNRLDTECVDGGPGRIRMEQWLTQDVPRWVYTHLRVAAGRSSWATLGASAGGWCTLMATTLHPDVFGSAISLGGYARPDFDPSYVPFGPNSELGRRYDLVRLARQAPPAVALWVLASRPDSLSYPQTTALAAATRAPMSVTPTILPSGGHRSSVWEPYFPSALTWLGHVSRGFAPL